MIRLAFNAGTLEIRGSIPGASLLGCIWDERSGCLRAPALAYADVVRHFVRAGIPYTDDARQYADLELRQRYDKSPRPFQTEALEAWIKGKGRGVVVLPTGAGKSHLAVMAMASKKRQTLVVAPTLDLVRQWYDLLGDAFGLPVGVIGGGDYSVEGLTVTTYDSAYLHMENLGSRFGMVVFDECHHLPGESYALAAKSCLAPFRLGLSATPERSDGRHTDLDGLIGPTLYRKDIIELSGEYLADYTVKRVAIELTDEELEAYREARSIYRDFILQNAIRMSEPDGWTRFIMLSARSEAGRRAMQAYRRQRALAFAAPSKLSYLEQLLCQHRKDRVLVFTQDNATAYRISRRFLMPVITHQTRVPERSEILGGFRSGIYQSVVTSKVLNEGVDVPEANVAVIISGSGSVREHVQRLGRILRKKHDGAPAILYEVVAQSTAETYTSQRRREHSAYR